MITGMKKQHLPVHKPVALIEQSKTGEGMLKQFLYGADSVY